MSFNLFSFLGIKHQENSEQIKNRLKTRQYQKEIATWVESVLRPLGNKDLYFSLAKQEPFFNPTQKNIEEIFETLYPYTLLGSPGHDLGHHSRDILGAAAIIGNDTHLAKALPNDITAAFFGGAYHDLGNGTWPRYQDNLWECGHAEVGAWMFYNLTKKHLPEHIRRLTSYAIAAHTHVLTPIDTSVGYVRKPWLDQLYYTSDQRPVGVAIWVTRFTDRLDTNGISLLCRHIIAQVNASKDKGRDFSGNSWYEINENSADSLLRPYAKEYNNFPTALLHLKNAADSGRKITPYSQHDDNFPIMKKLMAEKISQTDSILSLLKLHNTKDPNLQCFKKLLRNMSQSPIIDDTLDQMTPLWQKLSHQEKLKWHPIFLYCQKNYKNFLNKTKDLINQSPQPFASSLKNIIPKIVDRVSYP